MSTAIIQIGNTDDKLSQLQWSKFIKEVQSCLVRNRFLIHFFGTSQGDAPWQNACWVIDVGDITWSMRLRDDLGQISRSYQQNSIALIIGTTELIK